MVLQNHSTRPSLEAFQLGPAHAIFWTACTEKICWNELCLDFEILVASFFNKNIVKMESCLYQKRNPSWSLDSFFKPPSSARFGLGSPNVSLWASLLITLVNAGSGRMTTRWESLRCRPLLRDMDLCIGLLSVGRDPSCPAKLVFGRYSNPRSLEEDCSSSRCSNWRSVVSASVHLWSTEIRKEKLQ